MRHQERAATVKRGSTAAGLPVMPSDSHIVPVLVGDARCASRRATCCWSATRIYVQPINYPTVPRGTERLRLTPTPLHGDDDMTRSFRRLQDVWQTLGLGLRRRRE